MNIRGGNLIKKRSTGSALVESLSISMLIGIVSIIPVTGFTPCIKMHDGTRIPLTEAQILIKVRDPFHLNRWDLIALNNCLPSICIYLDYSARDSGPRLKCSEKTELSSPPHLAFQSNTLSKDSVILNCEIQDLAPSQSLSVLVSRSEIGYYTS